MEKLATGWGKVKNANLDSFVKRITGKGRTRLTKLQDDDRKTERTIYKEEKGIKRREEL